MIRYEEQPVALLIVTDESSCSSPYPDAATAERAVKELDGLEVMGRQLRADHAQKKDGGGGGGRGGGSYGGGKSTSLLPPPFLNIDI